MVSEDLKIRVISATFGALLTSLAVTPLDVVKVRLQGQLKGHSSNFLSTSEALLKIFKNEGLISLYRGIAPTILMSVPGTVIYFVGYERIHELIEGRVPGGMTPLLAGSSARLLAATAVSPIELVRTRMQFQGGEHGKLQAVIGNLVKSIRREGIKPLWRGLQPTLWRDVPFSAIYWCLLENSRKIFSRKRDGEEESPLKSSLNYFVYGAGSGAIAAALTTPFDVAKTRQQVKVDLDHPAPPASSTEHRNVWHQLRLIAKEEGWRGLTRGMTARVAKVAPACAIMIGSYEFGKIVLKEA